MWELTDSKRLHALRFLHHAVCEFHVVERLLLPLPIAERLLGFAMQRLYPLRMPRKLE